MKSNHANSHQLKLLDISLVHINLSGGGEETEKGWEIFHYHHSEKVNSGIQYELFTAGT